MSLLQDLSQFLHKINTAMASASALGVELSPQMARSTMENFSAYSGQTEPLCYEQRKQIGSEQPVAVTVFSPDPDCELPVALYLHGGGHVCGNTEIYAPICRRIASKANCIVVAVDYRLAPEHKYPAGLDDCYQAAVDYRSALDDICYSDELIVIGDSAGGALCATLASRRTEDQRLCFDKQILIYPSLDYTMAHCRRSGLGRGFLLEENTIAWYFDQYFAEDADRGLASPLSMPLPDNSLRTLIVSAGYDPLYPEAQQYFDLLIEQGANAEHIHFENTIHAFMSLHILNISECNKTYQEIAAFIQS